MVLLALLRVQRGAYGSPYLVKSRSRPDARSPSAACTRHSNVSNEKAWSRRRSVDRRQSGADGPSAISRSREKARPKCATRSVCLRTCGGISPDSRENQHEIFIALLLSRRGWSSGSAESRRLPAILIEDNRERQSRLWYRRQAGSAVSACSGARIWDHKWLAIRAIATGWVFTSIVIRLGMREVVHPWWDTVAPHALYPVIALFAWLANGWLIRPPPSSVFDSDGVGVRGLPRRRSVSPVYAAAMASLSGARQCLRLGALVPREQRGRHDLWRRGVRLL